MLLRQGFYPYEYIDSWKRFDQILSHNKDVYSNLNLEDITDVGYRHTKKYIHKEFKMNNLGEYHDLYVQSDTMLQ